MTTIVNIKKTSNYNIYIGRRHKLNNLPESIFHNPFKIGVDGTRDEVIEKFRQYALTNKELMNSLYLIDDKILGCYCDVDKEKCHGQVLIELREKQKNEPWLKNLLNDVTKIKLAVVGSRSIKNSKIVFDYLDKHKDRIDYIISGGAIGPDSFGNEWCKKNGFPIKIHYPDWDTHGKSAGFKRNCEIIRECDFAAIFWDGSSKGTKDDIDLCKDLGKKHRVIICND